MTKSITQILFLCLRIRTFLQTNEPNCNPHLRILSVHQDKGDGTLQTRHYQLGGSGPRRTPGNGNSSDMCVPNATHFLDRIYVELYNALCNDQ